MNKNASDIRAIKRALISVSDKSGIVSFAQALVGHGVDIVSTGGTRQALVDAGVPCLEVAEVTGYPEMLGGRVRTLHPGVHGALLSKRNDPGHQREIREHNITPIDLVVSNLYPFEDALAANADPVTLIETIDIGGPSMIRASAKNHHDVTVLVDAGDFARVLGELATFGGTRLATRRALAAKAFARTAAYDAVIANWFAAQEDDQAPQWCNFSGTLAQALRYGENPHQQAAFYRTTDTRPGVATAQQLQGKTLSYNNINDTDAAYELVMEFDSEICAGVAIIKHANPCGVACAETLTEAYEKALRCDPVSAFGGVVALNRTLDAVTAARIADLFTEVVIAPRADEDALRVLAARKNLRLLLSGNLGDPRASGLLVRSVAGGLLVQTHDNCVAEDVTLDVVSKRSPGETERRDMMFAWRVVKHVKSNAIVYAKDEATVGIGAGQMSRVDASHMAARKAAEAAKAAGLSHSLAAGAVVASDAFFPFADGLLKAAQAGVTAVIQPGGSKRDEEVIKAADAAGLAMVFTGVRHFRH